MQEVDIGCTKQVARILSYHDYTVITLKTRFQLTGTVKVKQRAGHRRQIKSLLFTKLFTGLKFMLF